MTKVYFKGLNGIRFIAAFLVIIHHVEYMKSLYKLPNYYDLDFFHGGVYGVHCFFVLSGFLITYLLLEEEKNTGKIHIKNFYVRRILRIWPIYYLMIIVALFAAPHFLADSYYLLDWNKEFWERFAMYVVFLPNLAFIMFPWSYYSMHLWSIGVEEQFYLVWPVLLKMTRDRLIPVLILVVMGFTLSRLVLLYINTHFSISPTFTDILYCLSILKFNLMGIGAIGAVLYYQKDKYKTILNVIFHPITQCITYALLIILMVIGFSNFYVNDIVTGTIFLILILNISLNEKSFVNLENRYMNYLGKISYGMYVYHMIVIGIAIKLWYTIFPIQNSNVLLAVMYVFCLGLTTLVSGISYKYIETPFLKLKDTRFAMFADNKKAT